MGVNRLGKLISKANELATQVGQEYQKAKVQYQQQQSQQQQQGSYGLQQGGYQQQAGSWQQTQTPGWNNSPSASGHHHQQGYQGYQPPTPQANEGIQQPGPQQHQQYTPQPQYPYSPPPQHTGYSPASTSSSQTPQSYQDLQTQIEDQRQTAEKLAAQAQEQYKHELAAANVQAEQIRKDQEEQLRIANVEMQRLKQEQEMKLKEAEKELERLRIRSDQVPGPVIPPRPNFSSDSVPQVSGEIQVGGKQHQHYPPPPPGGPPPPAIASPRYASHNTQQPYFAPPPTQPVQTSPQHYQGSPAQPAPPNFVPPAPFQPQTRPQQSQQHAQQLRTPQPNPSENTFSTPRVHPCGVVPLTECVNEPMPFELDWFTHSSAPDFLICTKCYVDNIYNTQFRSSFRVVHLSNSQPRKCHFGSRRMRDTLWPAAVSSSNLNNVIEFMQRRQNIAHCPEADLMKGANWYSTPNIPNATFCPACYEDLLMSCSFGSHFSLTTCADAYCDGDTMYFKRMFEHYAANNDWRAFAGQVQARLQYPSCERLNPVPSRERKWFEATRGPKGMQICIACFCDYFYNTPNQEYWRETVPNESTSRCFMGHANVFFMTVRAVQKKDHNLFWTAMEEWAKQPICSPQGGKDTKWYTLSNSAKNFQVCSSCYATLVCAYGGSHWFVPKALSMQIEDAHICAFNGVNPRFKTNILTFIESIYRGTSRPLENYAAQFANVPPCPMSKTEHNPQRRWWGTEDAKVCEECYLTFAKGNALESQYTLHGVLSPGATVCHLYSSRIAEAATVGSVQNLPGSESQQQQQELFNKRLEMDRNHLERQTMLNKAHTAALMANMTKFSGDVAGSHGYTVGNSWMGYGYANEMSFQGAVELQQAHQMANQALDPRFGMK